ncbi:alpha/beta hydrolase [Priestia aryabhattai]|uniref:alpha/beta hydrolase n=1 Tax=Priestia megaterium TaxID=1404 RepID=UPI003F9D7084
MKKTVVDASEVNLEASYNEKRIELESNGNKLIGLLDKPELEDWEKVPLVILMHGLSVSKDFELYKRISDELLIQNVATLRFDFNGHGESDGEDYEMTVPKEIEDARTFYDYTTGLDFVSDIVLLGHSQGGLVAGLLAGGLGPEKAPYLIQMAPAAAAKDLPSTGIFAGQKLFDPENRPEKLEFPNTFCVGKEYLETVEKLPIYETAKKYNGKVLLLHGSGDIFVDPSYADKYNEAYSDSEFHLIDGENHNFSFKIDETLNYIITFINKNVK